MNIRGLGRFKNLDVAFDMIVFFMKTTIINPYMHADGRFPSLFIHPSIIIIVWLWLTSFLHLLTLLVFSLVWFLVSGFGLGLFNALICLYSSTYLLSISVFYLSIRVQSSGFGPFVGTYSLTSTRSSTYTYTRKSAARYQYCHLVLLLDL